LVIDRKNRHNPAYLVAWS